MEEVLEKWLYVPFYYLVAYLLNIDRNEMCLWKY